MTETLTYSRRGDYLIPGLTLDEPPRELAEPLGRYARMRKDHLKKHRPTLYSRLLLTERLYPHLREVDEAAALRMEQAMNALTERERKALPDKAGDPTGWAAKMNALKAQAEEMVLHELIYS